MEDHAKQLQGEDLTNRDRASSAISGDGVMVRHPSIFEYSRKRGGLEEANL